MEDRRQRVGLLGLGVIGERYRDNLLPVYADLVVYDLDAHRVDAAVGAGATAAKSAADLASQCDVVVVSLPNPDAVAAALSGTDGLFSAALRGTVVLDTSTVSPRISREMYERAAAVGAHYLDAPVSGGEPMEAGMAGAAAGTMTFMVGGDESAYELARPVMEVLGSFSFYLGPAGSGTIVKLISNLCSGIYVLVTAEAFALGQACGFGPERLMEVFQHTDAKTYMTSDYVMPRLVRNDLAPGFSIELQLKDHRLAAELGHEMRVALPINNLAVSLWELMRAQGRAGNDIADACRYFAELARTTLATSGVLA